jgi:hypothetical protein
MARNPKQDANLKPYQKGELSSEEAKRRGSKGGKKSGEVRRAKRDAKSSIRYLLDLAAKDNLDTNLKKLGAAEEERTNMQALNARIFTMAMSGNLDAYKALMDYGGFAPDQNLKDEERRARIQAIVDGGRADAIVSGGEDGESGNVVIYMPKLDELPDEEELIEESSQNGNEDSAT